MLYTVMVDQHYDWIKSITRRFIGTKVGMGKPSKNDYDQELGKIT
jgi:hypothetical protein